MNKEKLKLAPFNLLWCIPTFFLSYIGMDLFFGLPASTTLLISFVIYLMDVRSTNDYNYLENKIEELEEKIK